MAETSTIPLFPLNTVLFPGGPLPLRIFEPRYVDMVSRCMKEDLPFGVVLLVDGAEAGPNQSLSMMSIGTKARICDWFQGSDGLLGITALGTERFAIRAVDRQDDGLTLAETEELPPEPATALPSEFGAWPELLRAVMADLGKLYESVEPRYDDASWVGFRFAEILPLELPVKQQCLEIQDPLERLQALKPLLQQLRAAQIQ